jgi:hypothetical protein
MAATKSPLLRLLHIRDEIDVHLPQLRPVIIKMIAEFQ